MAAPAPRPRPAPRGAPRASTSASWLPPQGSQLLKLRAPAPRRKRSCRAFSGRGRPVDRVRVATLFAARLPRNLTQVVAGVTARTDEVDADDLAVGMSVRSRLGCGLLRRQLHYGPAARWRGAKPQPLTREPHLDVVHVEHHEPVRSFEHGIPGAAAQPPLGCFALRVAGPGEIRHGSLRQSRTDRGTAPRSSGDKAAGRVARTTRQR